MKFKIKKGSKVVYEGKIKEIYHGWFAIKTILNKMNPLDRLELLLFDETSEGILSEIKAFCLRNGYLLLLDGEDCQNCGKTISFDEIQSNSGYCQDCRAEMKAKELINETLN